MDASEALLTTESQAEEIAEKGRPLAAPCGRGSFKLLMQQAAELNRDRRKRQMSNFPVTFEGCAAIAQPVGLWEQKRR